MNLSSTGQLLSLMRTSNAIHPVLAVLVGFLIAQANISIFECLLAAGVFTLIHSLVTVWNDIEDRQIDLLNGRNQLTILYENGYKRWVYGLIVALGVIAALGCFFLPLTIVALLLIYLGLAWLYNSKPVHASRRPILSMIILWLCYGLIPISLGLSFGQIEVAGCLIALAWSLSRLSLSLLKDFKDASGDALSNKRTFLLVNGKTSVAMWSVTLAATGLTGIVVGVFLVTGKPESLLLGVCAAVLLAHRVQLFGTNDYKQLHQIFTHSLRLQTFFDGMVILCLITWSPFL